MDHVPHSVQNGKAESVCSYELIPDAEAILADWEMQIRKAKSSIKMQFHTYEADLIGQRVSGVLLEAAERGIKVQLLVDYYTDLYHSGQLIHLPRLNKTVRQALRSEWEATKLLFQIMKVGGIQIKRTNSLGFLFRKSLWRDHKKLVIIDSEDKENQVAYVGGINVAEHHITWHDFMVKMRGCIVTYLDQDFDRTWSGEANSGRQIHYGDGYLITDSPGRSLIFEEVLQVISMAKRRVILESPYVCGQKMQRALTNAAERGVDVSLIVPLHNNHRISVLTQRSLKYLARSGLHIYQYRNNGGMTHAKALLADDLAVFGSSNFNQFLAGKLGELSIVSPNRALVSQLEVLLNKDMTDSMHVLPFPSK